MKRLDAVIVGAGPGGLAAAIRLASLGHSVHLLHRATRENAREGETLAPTVKAILSQLGVWNEFLATRPIPCPGITAQWGASEFEEIDFGLRCGWSIDRDKFDGVLQHAAAAHGVPVSVVSRAANIEKNGTGWRVTYMEDGAPKQLESRFVIDASGRSAILARRMGVKRIAFDNMICVLRFGVTSAKDPRIVIESVPDGWWYASILPGNRALVAFMTDPGIFNRARSRLNDRWRRNLKKAPLMCSWSSEIKFGANAFICSANTYRQNQFAGKNWILLGDAAVAGDPLSGTGTAHALLSAVEAADAIHSTLDGDRDALEAYSGRMLLRYEEGLAQRRGWYSQERRWRDKPFWAGRIQTAGFGIEGAEERLVFRT